MHTRPELFHRIFLILHICLLSSIVSVSLASAATPPPGPSSIIVSPTGSGATCSAAAPCSLNGGMVRLSAGETLYMRGGTYVPGVINLPAGTSWQAPVTIRNWPGEIVQIGDGVATKQRFATTAYAAQYVIIEGDYVATRTPPRGIIFNKAGLDLRGTFQIIRNVRVTGGTGTSAVSVGNDSQLWNLEVDHNGGTTSTLNHGIYSHASRLLIDGGDWHHNVGGYAMHLQNSKASTGGGCVAGQDDTPATPNGCGGIDVIVRNVTLRENGHGLLMRRGLRGFVSNNMVYRNGARGIWVESSNAVVANNTVTENNVNNSSSSFGNCQVGTKPSVSIINNVVVNSARGRPPFCENDAVTPPGRPNFHHNVSGNGVNAGFVNPATGNYRLTASSPARDAGVNLAGVPRDFFGASRPVGSTSDIGSHEFGGVITCATADCDPPSVPTNLVLTLDTPTQISGDWADSSGSPASYQVYRCDTAPGASTCLPTQHVLSPTLSAFVNVGLLANRTYTYALTAVDLAGNVSLLSNPVSLTTTAAGPDAVAPSVPTGCSAVAQAVGAITLTCAPSTDNVAVTGYGIKRCSGAGCTPTVIVGNSNTPVHLSQNLTASTLYRLTMAARDAVGNTSADSSIVEATTLADPVTPTTLLRLNNDAQDASGQGHHGTNTGVTFDATNKVEGSHAGIWDTTTDRLTIPMTDFLNPNQLTIAVNVRPTSFGGALQYIVGHTTTPIFANRIQLCVNATGMLGLGLGSSPGCALNPAVRQLVVNTWYYLALRLDNTAYTLEVVSHADGVVHRTSGTYTGLTTLAAVLTLGNNQGGNTQGWMGQMDALTVSARVWTDAEVEADCDLVVPGGCDTTPPTFDPLIMDTGVHGDGALSPANTRVVVTTIGVADPAVCTDHDPFFYTYAGVREPVISCSLTASTLTLLVASPPPSPATVLALKYQPTGQQISVVNQTVPEVTTGDGLQQSSWWCRPDGATAPEHWVALPNEQCSVPSPGILNVRVDLVNIGASTSPDQGYVLFCDTDPLDLIPAQRIVEDSTSPLGVFLNQSTYGEPDGSPRVPVLPTIPGVTAVTAGTMERNDLISIAPALAPNTRTEYEFSLAFSGGLARGTVFHCGLRPAASGAALEETNLATIRIDESRWFVQ